MIRLDTPREQLIQVLPSWFQQQMLEKLNANAHKPRWRTESTVRLLWLFFVEVGELLQAIALRRPAQEIVAEAADVANFMLFLADKAVFNAIWRPVGATVRVTRPGPYEGMVGTVREPIGSGEVVYIVDFPCAEERAKTIQWLVPFLRGNLVLTEGEFEVIKWKRKRPWGK